ncbi:MAG: HD domain-containing protein [Pseudomonadota bacterium]
MSNRRSEFDVTGEIQVSVPEAVWSAVADIVTEMFPDADFSHIGEAFDDFHKLFSGRFPGYRGCDTVYHDMQHTLDMTLAMARLMGGYHRSGDDPQLDARTVGIGIIAALFHDSGYILRTDEVERKNGAEYTQSHVSRSAEFLHDYLTGRGAEEDARLAVEIVHYTGYEKSISEIGLNDPRHALLGKLLGTADLMAQMADRCYLEKCRDRLYNEFVLGGLAMEDNTDGSRKLKYTSGIDLLEKTPDFIADTTDRRLNGDFEHSYRYFEYWFDGFNPYWASMQQNLEYLQKILRGEVPPLLRRTPPCFTSNEESLDDTQTLVALKLKEFDDEAG